MTSSRRLVDPPQGPAIQSDPTSARRVPWLIGVVAWFALGVAASFGLWLFGAHRASQGLSLGVAPWLCLAGLLVLAVVWDVVAGARKAAKAATKQDARDSARYGGGEHNDERRPDANDPPNLDQHPAAPRGGFQAGTRLWFRLAFLMAIGAGAMLYHRAGVLADAAAAHGDWFVRSEDGARTGLGYSLAVGATELSQRLRRLERQTPTQQWIRALRPTLSAAQRADDERTRREGRIVRSTATWPHRIGAHEAASNVPTPQAHAPIALGHYFRDNTAGDFDTAHAIHSWISTQIRFDLEAHAGGELPPQDPVSVLQRRTAIGPGFAALFVAVGEAAGLDVRFVSGVARDHADAFVGAPHAWNAVGLRDGWMLVDASRDARDLEQERLLRQGEAIPPDPRLAQYANDEDLRLASYRPLYLGAPSEVFAVTHYPDEATWQLAAPQWRLPFTQRPLMRPEFFARGLKMDEGARAESRSGRDIVLEIENPQLVRMWARITALEDGHQTACTARGRELLTVRCTAERPGLHRVDLEIASGRLEERTFVGALRVRAQR